MTAVARDTPVWRIPGVLPVYMVFFGEAFVLGNWIPRIPDVKSLYGFSASELGNILFCVSFGTLFAFLIGGSVIKRLGLRGGCMVAGPLWALFMGLVPYWPNGWVLAIAAFLSGQFIGLLEISMNSAADRLEQTSGRRLMSKAHGFWSLGSLAGALVGTQFAVFAVPVKEHFTIIMSLSALMALAAAVSMPKFDRKLASEAGDKASHAAFRLPNRGIILLCIMPIGIMLVEGAFIDWSALFMKQVLEAGPVATGSIFSAFAAVMAATRLSGDWLLDMFGPRRVAFVSALSATLGIAVFSLAPNVPVAFVGALFSGLGVAVFYPLTMTAAARRPGDPEDNVAAMSLFAFTAFMFAPPTVGYIADQTGLRIALALLIPLAASSLLLLSELDKGR